MTSNESTSAPEWRLVNETLLPELELTEVRREQLKKLDELYFKDVSGDSILEILDQRQNKPFWTDCTSMWRLENHSEPVYDVYMYGADSGTVFEANTAEVVAEIVQRRLQPYDEDAGLAIAIAAEESDLAQARNYTLRDAWSWQSTP